MARNWHYKEFAAMSQKDSADAFKRGWLDLQEVYSSLARLAMGITDGDQYYS